MSEQNSNKNHAQPLRETAFFTIHHTQDVGDIFGISEISQKVPQAIPCSAEEQQQFSRIMRDIEKQLVILS